MSTVLKLKEKLEWKQKENVDTVGRTTLDRNSIGET
jgi:hypothetical protein